MGVIVIGWPATDTQTNQMAAYSPLVRKPIIFPLVKVNDQRGSHCASLHLKECDATETFATWALTESHFMLSHLQG